MAKKSETAEKKTAPKAKKAAAEEKVVAPAEEPKETATDTEEKVVEPVEVEQPADQSTEEKVISAPEPVIEEAVEPESEVPEADDDDDSALKAVDTSRLADEVFPGSFTHVGFSKTIDPETVISKNGKKFKVVAFSAERTSDKGKPFFDYLIQYIGEGDDPEIVKRSLFKGTFEIEK